MRQCDNMMCRSYTHFNTLLLKLHRQYVHMLCNQIKKYELQLDCRFCSQYTQFTHNQHKIQTCKSLLHEVYACIYGTIFPLQKVVPLADTLWLLLVYQRVTLTRHIIWHVARTASTVSSSPNTRVKVSQHSSKLYSCSLQH